MSKQESRAGQLNAIIDPKLLFLAKLAARYKGQTLIEFIEDAFRRALTPAAVLGDEPTTGHQARPKQEAPLWFEGLWHEDEVARLFYVATADLELLTPKQRDAFLKALDTLIKQGKKVTLKNFVESFDRSERGE